MKKQGKKLIETHGKVESNQPTTLEQVWGFNEMSRYGTMDANVYDDQIKEMTRSDLENHARKMGVLIVESSSRLLEKCRQEFSNYVMLLRKPAEAKTKIKTKFDPAALKVLAEGR